MSGKALTQLTPGASVRVTIELPDGRTIVTDGLFHEASITNDVVEMPDDGTGWMKHELTGASWFTLTLRRETSTVFHPAIKP